MSYIVDFVASVNALPFRFLNQWRIDGRPQLAGFFLRFNYSLGNLTESFCHKIF